MDYFLTILIVFVIWLGIQLLRDRKHEKQVQQYQAHQQLTAEDAARIASLEADFAARLEKKGLSWLMAQDYSFRQTITPPATTPLAETERQLQLALIEILEHLHLLPIVRLEVTDDPSKLSSGGRLGEYDGRASQKVIRLLVKSQSSPATILDALCHEATHFFMSFYQIADADRNRDEGLTEVGICMIGFSEVALSEDFNRSAPYLRLAEFQEVRRLLLKRRATMQASSDPRVVREQLQRNLRGVGPMLEQTRAMIAANSKPNPRRMSASAVKAMQKAMLALETGEYEETLRRAEAALQKDANAIREADSEVLAICGTLFQVMLAFRPD